MMFRMVAGEELGNCISRCEGVHILHPKLIVISFDGD